MPVVIKDMVDTSGKWDWSWFSTNLPEHVLHKITTITPPTVPLDRTSRVGVGRMIANLQDSSDFARDGENWKEHFPVFCWMIWKHRSSLIFDESYVQRDDLRLCCEKLSAEFVTAFHCSNVRQVLRVHSVWKRPTIGW
ncbi:hypothetical protein V6N11_053756 [Hibiscus sabdariffa]|uniref:Aminotransferase-like plant mobile domain-containing protein n=1 Tax=Hibiscus sabdariffa TaxID=183260 RepID=A0ABR2S1T5_9ROSI